MKKILALVLSVLMVAALFAGCGQKPAEGSKPAGFDYEAIPNEMTSADGKYTIAFVTDVGQLLDKSFNPGTWEGVKRYATENSKSYKYYQPANGDQATDADRYDAMRPLLTTALRSSSAQASCRLSLWSRPLRNSPV